MRRGAVAGPASSAAPASSWAASASTAAPASFAAPDSAASEDLLAFGFGVHHPARLAKRLKTAMKQRELTAAEQAALRVAKAEWNKERAERRQRKKG